MSEDQQARGRADAWAAFWRMLAVALLTLFLGAIGEWLLRGRDVATKDDIATLQISISELKSGQNNQGNTISDIKTQLGVVEEDLRLGARGTGPKVPN